MTDEERYLFDLRGYVVLRGVLPVDFLTRANCAIDELEKLDDEALAARGLPRRYLHPGDVLAQGGKPTGNGWPDYDFQILPYGEFGEELIDWPYSLSRVRDMISHPCRLDAASFMSRNSGGVFHWHHGGAELLPYSE